MAVEWSCHGKPGPLAAPCRGQAPSRRETKTSNLADTRELTPKRGQDEERGEGDTEGDDSSNRSILESQWSRCQNGTQEGVKLTRTNST